MWYLCDLFYFQHHFYHIKSYGPIKTDTLVFPQFLEYLLFLCMLMWMVKTKIANVRLQGVA